MMRLFKSRRLRETVETTILKKKKKTTKLAVRRPGHGQPLAPVRMVGWLLGGPFARARVLPRNDESSDRAVSEQEHLFSIDGTGQTFYLQCFSVHSR
jgi:hypothetical protein